MKRPRVRRKGKPVLWVVEILVGTNWWPTSDAFQLKMLARREPRSYQGVTLKTRLRAYVRRGR